MPIENKSASEYEDTPTGWASRWQFELSKAKEALKDFYAIGTEVEEVLRDEQKDNGGKRLCLFAATTQMTGAVLYGRTPQASVTRKFADARDDVARVASEMLERVLNCDIERADDTFAEATRNAMLDWRGPGLGVQRHRYQATFEKKPGEPAKQDEKTGAEVAPAIPETETKSGERIDTDYVHWQDFLWGQCRVWSEVPWVAFLAKMTREELVQRFGEKVGNQIPLNARHRSANDNTSKEEEEKSHPWDRAGVWEIWHKATRKVFWVVDGFQQTLDIKPDPLELEGFFPCQKPMMANLTTAKMIPVPDYKFAQDLYSSADVLLTRCDLLVDAVGVKGGYAKELGDTIKKIVTGKENGMVPVDEWAMFAEKGGLQGAIVWLPVDQIVAALTVLDNRLTRVMDLIYQITGQSDLVRGQQTANGTPGEAKIKAKSASVRIQAMQDEIARFASDGQKIRAEIIAKHFDPQTIIAHSNVMETPDGIDAETGAPVLDKKTGRPLVEVAAELLRSRLADYRVEIKPEAINLTDFAAMKEERIEVMSAIGAFFQQAAPIMQMGPKGQKFALQMLQVTLAGLKGSAAYEGIIDQAIAELEQAQKQAAANPQPAPPDPKLQAEQAKLQGIQMKGQMDMAKEQFKLQADMQRTQADVAADDQREQNQMLWNTKEAAAKQQIASAAKALEPHLMPKPPGMP